MHGGAVEEHTVEKAGSKRPTYRCRWFEQAPLRDGRDAMLVNWVGVTITDAKGGERRRPPDKATYDNAFVTSLPVTRDTAELVACARRWKVENEGFNVLKSNGYHLEHNFGHGKQNLAMMFAAMRLACCHKKQNGSKVAPACRPSLPTTACSPNARADPG